MRLVGALPGNQGYGKAEDIQHLNEADESEKHCKD